MSSPCEFSFLSFLSYLKFLHVYSFELKKTKRLSINQDVKCFYYHYFLPGQQSCNVQETKLTMNDNKIKANIPELSCRGRRQGWGSTQGQLLPWEWLVKHLESVVCHKRCWETLREICAHFAVPNVSPGGSQHLDVVCADASRGWLL